MEPLGYQPHGPVQRVPQYQSYIVGWAIMSIVLGEVLNSQPTWIRPLALHGTQCRPILPTGADRGYDAIYRSWLS